MLYWFILMFFVFEKRTTVLVCNFINVMLVFMLGLIVCLVRGDTQDKYMRFGPQDDLLVFGSSIDTMSKFTVLQIIVFIFTVLDTLVQDLCGAFLSQCIFNPTITNIPEFKSRMELQVNSQIFFMANQVRIALGVYITSVQLDMALLNVLYKQMATCITIYVLTSTKTFVPVHLDKIVVENPHQVSFAYMSPTGGDASPTTHFKEASPSLASQDSL